MARILETDAFALTSDPRAYVPREATERVLGRLERWALRTGSDAIALTGPAGVGKSLLLNVFAQRIATRRTAVYVPIPTLLPDELCAWVLEALGEPQAEASEPSDPSEGPQGRLVERALARRRGGGLLVLIDDAHCLPPETLRQLPHWSRGSDGHLRWVLASDRPLDRARGAEPVSLATPLTLAEARALLEAAVQRARGDEAERARLAGVLDGAALARLHARSGGVPARLFVEAGRWLAAAGAPAAGPPSGPRQAELPLAAAPPVAAAPRTDVPRAEAPHADVPRAGGDSASGGARAAPGAPPDPARRGRRRWRDAGTRVGLGLAAGVAIGAAALLLRDTAARHPVAEPAPAGGTGLPSVAAPPPASSPSPARGRETLDPAPALPAEPAPAAPAETPADAGLVSHGGTLAEGQWLAAALRGHGIGPEVPERIAREVGALFDFRRSRPGDRWRIVRTRDGELVEFEYFPAGGDRIHLRRVGDGYVVERTPPSLAGAPPAR